MITYTCDECGHKSFHRPTWLELRSAARLSVYKWLNKIHPRRRKLQELLHEVREDRHYIWLFRLASHSSPFKPLPPLPPPKGYEGLWGHTREQRALFLRHITKCLLGWELRPSASHHRQGPELFR